MPDRSAQKSLDETVEAVLAVAALIIVEIDSLRTTMRVLGRAQNEVQNFAYAHVDSWRMPYLRF